MGSSFAGFVLDPSKCSELSMEEKRELVYELSQWTQGAPEMLQTWSRRELIQILSAEMGKERKYTGLTKIKLIEQLLKIVSKKNSAHHVDKLDPNSRSPPPRDTQKCSKRRKKNDNSFQVPMDESVDGSNHLNDSAVYCLNAACKANLQPGCAFCKRCSCCICHKFDDNKDPSLWLVCSSEHPNEEESCGMSCHLECAFKHEKAGILEDGIYHRLDGSFYCISCNKVNDLLGCWRKQLVIAKDARRIDALCYRIFLSRRLLTGTEKFQNLHEIVQTAAEKLEAEVGTLDGLPIRMARIIVNRLSCGTEIQKLCSTAVEMLDSILSRPSTDVKTKGKILTYALRISFEDVSSTSFTVVLGSMGNISSKYALGFNLWYRRFDSDEYSMEPVSTFFHPDNQYSVSGLTPDTEYIFKVVSFSNGKELENCEARITTLNDTRKNMSNLMDRIVVNNTKDGDLSNSSQSCSEYINEASHRGMPAVDVTKDVDHLTQRSEVSDGEELFEDSVSALDDLGANEMIISAPNTTIQSDSQRDSTNSSDENQASNVPKQDSKSQPEFQLLEEISIDNDSNAAELEKILVRRSDCLLPATPWKQDMVKDGPKRILEKWPVEPEKEAQAGSSSKKRNAGRNDEKQDKSVQRDYEYCVKVIRCLECEGHIQKSFREKFLTWFSLRATPQERKIVNVYVDTLIDEPFSLAGQLVDTFSEGICSKKPLAAPKGFCMKLWH